MGLRLRALHEVHGQPVEHLYLLHPHDPLSPRVTREGEERSHGEIAVMAALTALTVQLAAARRPPLTLLVIDTVRASLSGSEDSSEHVSAYLRAVRRLLGGLPGAAAILAHHAGWQDGESQRKRERGSSAWRGNCDATLYLEAGEYDADRGEAPLTLRTLKVRDAERQAPLHLIRRRVDLLERDRYGKPVTSCVIEPDRRTREDREATVAAAAQADEHALDLNTLQAVANRPELATSQDHLRLVLGIRKTRVSESLARLVRLGWVVPGGRKQPYRVTAAGAAALQVQP